MSLLSTSHFHVFHRSARHNAMFFRRDGCGKGVSCACGAALCKISSERVNFNLSTCTYMYVMYVYPLVAVYIFLAFLESFAQASLGDVSNSSLKACLG